MSSCTKAYIYPSSVLQQSVEELPAFYEKKVGATRLTEEQVTSWRENGFALVDGLFTLEFAHRCQQEAYVALMNDPGVNFGSADGKMEFPTGLKSLDAMTLHPNLLHAAGQLLKEDPNELRLIQSDVWLKKGKEDIRDPLSNQDQRIHCDYGNNTLVHPPGWYEPEVVSMIVYLSNEEESGGGTAVAPRFGSEDPMYQQTPLVGMPGYGGIKFINDRTCAEEYMDTNHPEYSALRKQLYAREKCAKYKVGTVLLYRHDVWHRGTPILPKKWRIVMNLGYRKKECTWVTTWNMGWARHMYNYPDEFRMEKILAESSLLQRHVLGFPPPGHKYWTKFTIQATDARYKTFGFDSTPYYQALSNCKNKE
jgi:hypothetical protein